MPIFDSHSAAQQVQTMRILIIDDQPEECARLKAAIENIPDVYYQLSVVDEVQVLEKMNFYLYDLCIVDNKALQNTACEVVKRHHLDAKLPTIIYEPTSLLQIVNGFDEVLNLETLSSELMNDVIQHAYTQFHAEKELVTLSFVNEKTGLSSKRLFEYQNQAGQSISILMSWEELDLMCVQREENIAASLRNQCLDVSSLNDTLSIGSYFNKKEKVLH